MGWLSQDNDGLGASKENTVSRDRLKDIGLQVFDNAILNISPEDKDFIIRKLEDKNFCHDLIKDLSKNGFKSVPPVFVDKIRRKIIGVLA